MRRVKFWPWAVIAALLLTMVSTLSVQAAKPSPRHTVFFAVCSGVGPDFYGTGAAFHARDFGGSGYTYFPVDDGWVESGTQSTFVSGMNGMFPIAWMESGTFQLRDSLVGDYDGTFTWKQPGDGQAVGQGVGSSKGLHLKETILWEVPAGLPAPPSDPCHGSDVIERAYMIVSVY
jgi:hypothetical protein